LARFRMDRYVAKRNIARFEDLISKESDPAKRRIIEDLLAAEEQRLADLDSQDQRPQRCAGRTPR